MVQVVALEPAGLLPVRLTTTPGFSCVRTVPMPCG
jgi:hypothetical protein